MPLTWQDVAGQVRAPDPSGLNDMITRGVATVGQAVANLGSAPDQRRKEEAAKQLQMAQIVSAMAGQVNQQAQSFLKDKEVRDDKQAMKDFSTVQSSLEAGSRQAALAGKSLDDYLTGSKEYQGLSQNARAFAMEHLSNAWMKGDDTRISMAEHAADNARQQAQFNAQMGMEQQRLALARQEAADRRAERDLANAGKPKVWKTGDDKTDKAMTELARATGFQYNQASGAAYEDKTVSELAGKKYKNLGAVSDIFNSVNAARQSKGLSALPENVLKRIVDLGVGSNSVVTGMNGIDDAAITDALRVASDEYDTAAWGKQFYEHLAGRVESGSRPDANDIAKGLSMFKKKPAQQEPAAPSLSAPVVPTMSYNRYGYGD